MADDTFYLPDSYFHGEAAKAGKSVYELFPEFMRRPEVILPVNDKAEARDLAYRAGGRAAKPHSHVALYGPQGNPILIAALGVTEAAELEEMAIAVYEEEERKVSRGLPSVDFEMLRAESGEPSARDFDARFKEGLRDWARKQKRQWRTGGTLRKRTPRRFY